MAPVLKDYPRASFDKIEFPFTRRTARLEARTHTHEYPKMAGGSVEKLGRKLWAFTFDVPFHTTFENYPGLYPGRLDDLTERCARLDTAELLIPEIGTLRCILTKIDRVRQGRILSGEDCTLEFIEDDLEPFRRTNVPASKAGVAEAAAAIQLEMAKLISPNAEVWRFYRPERVEPLLSLVDSILAIRDQTTLFGLQVAGKLAQVQGLVRALHETLKGPDLDPLRRSLRNLWDATRRFAIDLTDSGATKPLKSYVVPSTLSIGQIAQRLYGNGARGGEILSLNSNIPDPYAVQAGTRLLVYAS